MPPLIMRPPIQSLRLLSALSTLLMAAASADGAISLPRIDVPLYFDSTGRYVMDISMSEAPKYQNFSFTFTTGTGMIYVAGSGGNLQSMAGTSVYNESASVSAQIVADSTSASMFGEPAGATVVKESCAIGGQDGLLWQYKNQTLVVLKNVSNNILEQAADMQLGKEVSGILGLGTNRVTPPGTKGEYNASFEDSVIGQWFLTYPEPANFTFGMAVGAPVIVPQQDSNPAATAGVPADSDAGMIHLLQPDASYYKADQVSWVTANASAGGDITGSIPPSDWTVVLDGWVASTQKNQLASKGQIVADLDPMYTALYVPQDQAALIHASIPGASLQKGLSTLGNLSMAYMLPCDSQFTFGIIVGSQTFTLDQSDLVVPMGNGKCVSSIEAWTDSWETKYVFGSRFLYTIYLIFNVPRNGAQQIGFSPRTDTWGKPPLDVKAIIGGSIGGAALLALTILGGLYLRKHWRDTRRHAGTSMITSILPSISERDVQPLHPKTAPGGSDWHIEPYTVMTPSALSYQTPQASPMSVSYPMSVQASSARHEMSPSPTSVILIPDERYSVNVAPPSYRGRESYQPQPPPSPGTIQTVGTMGSGTNYTTTAMCDGKRG